MVYSNEYQQIRRIFKKDVRAVMSLIRQSVRSEELVRRTQRRKFLTASRTTGCWKSIGRRRVRGPPRLSPG